MLSTEYLARRELWESLRMIPLHAVRYCQNVTAAFFFRLKIVKTSCRNFAWRCEGAA